MNVSANSATVSWTTSTPHSGSVRIADDSGGVQTAASTVKEFSATQTGLNSSYYQHRATVTNLKAGGNYSYQIQADGLTLTCPVSRPLQFRTADDGHFSFLHFADSGSGNANQLQLCSQMCEEDVSLVLANGDLAYENATFDSVESNYYGVYREMMARIPFFPALGNHEYYTDSARPSLAGRVTPTEGVTPDDWGRYYSFDWGNVHFVALDSNEPLTRAIEGNGDMLNFLEKTLRTTRKFWRVVFFHHPPYATGKHQDEPEADMVRRHIVPILEKYGVQLVLNGHEHSYQRTLALLGGAAVDPDSGGIVYITSGGGGADTFYTAPNGLIAQSLGMNNYLRGDVAGATMNLRTSAIGVGGEVDSIRLAPKPRITSPAVNAASFTSDLGAGGLITILGRNLCVSEFASSSSPVTEAAGSFVTLNGNRIPLLYAGPGQINAHIPFSFAGEATLEINTPNGSTQATVSVAPVAPALFVTEDGSRLAVALHEAGTLVDSSSPVRSSELVKLFLTGLGAVEGNLDPGVIPPSPVPVKARIQVLFGNVEGSAPVALLSSAAAGVYEVQVRVPRGLTGLTTVRVIANGLSSNVALLPTA